MTQINGVNTNYQNQQINPDSYAQKYAEQNNISLEEAKQELKAKFGDPSESSSISAMMAGSANMGVAPMTNDTSSIFGGIQMPGGPKQQGDPNPLGYAGIMAGQGTQFNINNGAFMQGGPKQQGDPNPLGYGPQQLGDPEMPFDYLV